MLCFCWPKKSIVQGPSVVMANYGITKCEECLLYQKFNIKKFGSHDGTIALGTLVTKKWQTLIVLFLCELYCKCATMQKCGYILYLLQMVLNASFFISHNNIPLMILFNNLCQLDTYKKHNC